MTIKANTSMFMYRSVKKNLIGGFHPSKAILMQIDSLWFTSECLFLIIIVLQVKLS